MKERITSRDKYVFLTTFLAGIVTHLYVMTNKLPAYDDLDCVRSFGGGVSLGRWLLEVLGLFKHKLLGNYSSPAFNGLLSLLFVAIAVVLFCRIFDIEFKIWQTLIGILFVVFPVLTGYMIYMYTSYYYCFALAILMLGVYGFYLSSNGWARLLSVLCMAGAVSIYQAYLPFLISLLLIVLLVDTTKETSTWKTIIRDGVIDLAIIAAVLLVYMICNKILQIMMHVEISGMKGSNRVGSVIQEKGLGIVPYIYGTFSLPLTEDYYGLTGFVWMRIVYGIVYAVVIIAIVCLVAKSMREKKWGISVLQMVIALLLPLGLHSIYAMAEEQYFYTLMLYTDILVLITPVLLLQVIHSKDIIPKMSKLLSVTLACVLGFACLFYANQDNATYLQMDYAISGTKAYYTTVITQIKSIEEYNPNYPIVFAGTVDDPSIFDLHDTYFDQVNVGGAYGTEDMVKSIDLNLFLKQYLGFDQQVTRDTKLLDAQKITDMPCYPMPGSIQVIDKKIIVKFSNE